MTTSLLPSLLAFVAVVLMIPGALWLVKRAQTVRPGSGGPLSIVAAVSLGPRERVAVVHAGGHYLVIGVTGQSVSLLANLDQWPSTTPSSCAPTSPFAALLDRFNQNARKG